MMCLLNREKIAQLAAEIGPENIPMLLGIFLGELESYRVVLTDCDPAALEQQMSEISHALKSSAASFGADKLCHCAQEIDALHKQGKYTELTAQNAEFVELLIQTHAAYTHFS